VVDAQRLKRLVAQLQRHAQPSLPTNLVPLRIAGMQVGLAQREVARFVAHNVAGFALIDRTLTLTNDVIDFEARTALLALAAEKLRDAGMIPGWRNEAMAVGDPAVATIERAACRPLGITTQAVHLNAYIDTDTLVVARRAAHKQIDAGLWDNLVGGMVSAAETLDQTLQREAWEEAGLQLDRASLIRGRSFHVRRSVPEGLQSETIHVYDMRVPADAALANQDGEVSAIERRALGDVVEAIEHEEFTIESALVTLESLTRSKEDAAAGFFHWPAL
jgi:8-oxo-dGTP pyrophosphatase MutT (NUDIX family)